MKAHWTDSLNDAVYTRLCNCRTIKADIPQLVNAKWASYPAEAKAVLTKQDALVDVLELLEENSCFFDLTAQEIESFCR